MSKLCLTEKVFQHVYNNLSKTATSLLRFANFNVATVKTLTKFLANIFGSDTNCLTPTGRQCLLVITLKSRDCDETRVNKTEEFVKVTVFYNKKVLFKVRDCTPSDNDLQG
jgi:hypothetical protein